MGDLREIKNRIGSVKNTAQITKAMQMISASKMVKAQSLAYNSVPYSDLLFEIVSKMGDINDYKSVYLRKPTEVKQIGIVVIGTGRGFVGSQITGLTTNAYKLSKELKEQYPQATIKGISIHKTGLKILANARIKTDLHFAEYFENKNTTELTAVFNSITSKFEKGEYDLVYLVFTHFVNTMVQKVVNKQILPIKVEDLMGGSKPNSDHSSNPYIFEPSVNGILDKLLPEYFQTQIYTGILESIASEHSARMVAMKNATDNAKQLQKLLTLKYNRQRQASITQQLIEVVNGRKKSDVGAQHCYAPTIITNF